MSRITIAGNFPIPTGLSLNDKVRISADVLVYELKRDLIDVTPDHAECKEFLPGETQLETVAETCEIANA